MLSKKLKLAAPQSLYGQNRHFPTFLFISHSTCAGALQAPDVCGKIPSAVIVPWIIPNTHLLPFQPR